MRIEVPRQVDSIIKRLAKNGFEAYIVGGCVRDSLLGIEPNDWDITTSARPEETERCLSNFKIVETGLKHGTVTVVTNSMPVEVTTYRVDGQYSDNRHPDEVKFTRSLKEDLARRDFTVNALAYGPEGIIDCFGGCDDLGKKRIRCVGNADKRFKEDGLRILRALRFASTLNFSVERETAKCILKNCALLDNIAWERIQTEFTKLLCGDGAERVLKKYRDVFARFIPEIKPSFDFEQNNPYHIYNVWEHTLNSVEKIEPEPILRLTMFLHDLGKPFCYSKDKKGVGHFYGHAKKSAEIARTILTRLKYDRHTADTVVTLIEFHDLPLINDERIIKRRLSRMGEANLRMLLKVKAADIKAQNPDFRGRLAALKEVESVLNSILLQKQCFTLENLQISGSDLLDSGVRQGAEIGRILGILLKAVIDDKCENTRSELLKYAQNLRKQ